VLNEIAANGYYTFFQALLSRAGVRGADAPYEGWYATRPESAVTARLAQLLREQTTAPRAMPARPVNVVLVLDESFGAEFVSALRPRDSLPITPSFDSLVAEGTVLTHAYSTGNRTIRAIEATSISIPPLPGISIVQRVQSMNLFTLASVLRANGYSTEFVYGGRAPFDGMGSYESANGFEQVFDQGKFPPGSFTTAWGVADEVIFDGALAQMDSLHRTGKPFYTMILTVSNHKPYTYPAGRIPQNPNEHRRTFAVRYSDWAIGRFVRAAQSHAFFDNTLFVIMGDHGARVYGAAEIPLPSYEVPVVYYAPKFVKAGVRISTMTSLLDVPPTILSLLGINVEAPFFGFDVLAADSARGRAFMTHNNELALMRGGRMAVLGLHESTTLYSVDPGGALKRIAVPDSAGRELIEDAIAYFYGADQRYRRGAFKFDEGRARKK
jgi:phosphoglycerol transferase MdoB-like AlkP superfamily enzyme